MDGERIFTVTELARALRMSVEAQFGVVVVRGEATNIRTALSGHTYFTLKDEESQVRCVLFRGTKALAERSLAEDAEYLVWGRLSLYEPRTEVSLVVSFFLPAGEGKEALRLKALKEKLFNMGVFDEVHKKKLPPIVEHIGVVTAPGGAAIQDIIRVGRDRYPPLRITLYPALVQGEEAEGTLVQGVETLGALPDIDAIIVGRGGGAKEDLRPFNGEGLALAVIACPVPVVAAVGHEIDKTILDLAASYSVSTPSAAAVLCTTPVEDLVERAGTFCADMETAVERLLREKYMRLDHLMLAIPRPTEWIQRLMSRLVGLTALLEKRVTAVIRRDEQRVAKDHLLFEKYNPIAPLERGFVVVRQNGRVVKRRAFFDVHAPFVLRFADGETPVPCRDGGKESADR